MTRLSWIAIVLWAAGCNNGGVGGGGNVDTVDGYETAAAHVICQMFTSCGQVSSSEESACESGYRALLSGTGYSLQDAIAAGRIGYNSSAAQSCLGLFSSLGCNFNSAGVDVNACRKIVTPKVQPGGMCLADEECIGGFCAHATGSTGCPGTCTSYLASGADCSATLSGCAPTQWCNTVSGTVCTDLGKQGDACSFGSCQSGLFCLDDSTGNTTCQPIPTQGQPCTYVCAADLRCDLSSMTCLALQKKGGACSDSTDCASGLGCAMAPQATSGGACQPFADLGKPCGTVGSCAGDANCDPTSNTCVGKGVLGADCSSSSCALFFTCDSSIMTCVAPGPAGSSCTTADECYTAYCDPTTHRCAIDCS